MGTVTGLGDASVTIAAAGLVFVCLLAGAPRVAVRWLAAVAACGVATGAAKLALYMHGAPIPPVWLWSPSGHVAASVLVYGVLPLAAYGPRRTWAAVAAGLVGLIAVSRVYLQAHSEADVVAGACIGSACLGWFLAAHAPARASLALRAGMPVVLVVCVTGALQGWRLHLDRVLHAFAAMLSG